MKKKYSFNFVFSSNDTNHLFSYYALCKIETGDETVCTTAKLPQGHFVCLSECRCLLQTLAWWRYQTMGGNGAERCQAGWGGEGGRRGCPGIPSSHEACTDFSPPAAHSLPSWCSSSPPAGAESCRAGPVRRGHPANTHMKITHTHTRMCNRIVWASAIYMWQHCKHTVLRQRFNSLSIKHTESVSVCSTLNLLY